MVLLACVLGALFVACAPRKQPVQVRFVLTTPQYVHRLQFYVHDVVLLGADGRDYRLELTEQAPWQSAQVALIDLPGDGGRSRDAIAGKTPTQTYTGVRFAVGVPFELNHQNPLKAIAPLTRGELFWSWQSGYKFLRLDLSAAEHEAAFHLGSTGCSSPSALRPPARPCAQPNVMRIELRGFDPLAEPIEVRVGELVAALIEAPSRACTGDYSQPACARAFAVTGLDPNTGLCADPDAQRCSSQRLFFSARVE